MLYTIYVYKPSACALCSPFVRLFMFTFVVHVCFHALYIRNKHSTCPIVSSIFVYIFIILVAGVGIKRLKHSQ